MIMSDSNGTTTDTTSANAEWSGDALLAMFTSGAQILESHVNLVNRLNVFPVQDGDTGINMLLTLRDTLEEAREADTTTAGSVANGIFGVLSVENRLFVTGR